MKLITRDTDYAIRAICFMAQNKEDLVSVSELVVKLKIPRPFLRKILQVLNKEKILKSYKGIGGGFKLARNPGEIRLVDVIKAFQGPLSLNECLMKKDICPNRKICSLKKKIDRIEEHVINEMEKITIKELLA